MKHLKTGRKFGRERNQRRALLRSLALSLIKNDKIKTTEAKAKEIRPFVEKLVTRAKIGSIYARRVISSTLGEGQDEAVKKLVDNLGPKYKDRQGGYTRITKLSPRLSDSAKMAVIEFV